MNDKGMLKF
jgi:hypothetical protein